MKSEGAGFRQVIDDGDLSLGPSPGSQLLIYEGDYGRRNTFSFTRAHCSLV